MQDTPLLIRAIAGLVFLAVMMAMCLFVPAGTLRYPEAWGFLAVFSGAALAITFDLYRHDRALLERRTRAGPVAETRGLQRVLQSLAGLAFLATLVVPGLDHRFAWSHLPIGVAMGGDVLVALGFWVTFRVFKANTFTAATIGVEVGQTVTTTGPYALVRHPMYTGALALMVGIPLALVSLWGLLPSLCVVAVIVARLLDEEALLVRDLPGYASYRETTRYRLVPYIW
jgi:protein-S-isoprenylcysteine O-methyltransferase Ste14